MRKRRREVREKKRWEWRGLFRPILESDTYGLFSPLVWRNFSDNTRTKKQVSLTHFQKIIFVKTPSLNISCLYFRVWPAKGTFSENQQGTYMAFFSLVVRAQRPVELFQRKDCLLFAEEYGRGQAWTMCFKDPQWWFTVRKLSLKWIRGSGSYREQIVSSWANLAICWFEFVPI